MANRAKRVITRDTARGGLAAIERRRNELAIRENRDRLKRILDSMFTFVGVLTLDGILVEVNRAPLEIADLKPEDVIGKPFAETYWWSHSPETQRALRQCLKRAAQGETVRRDFEMRAANGRLITIDFITNPLRNADDKITELVTSAVDITARKQAEDELRETSERFYQLANNITDVFWMRSPDFRRVVYVSPAFEKIWGRPPEELYSNPTKWVEFIFAEDRERVTTAFEQFQKSDSTGGALDIEYRIVWPAGEIRWIRARGFQIRDANGQIIRYAGVITDITERKWAEAALRKSEAQLRVLFEGAAIGMALVNPEGRPMQCNPAICRMLGYTEAELCRTTFDNLTHPDDVEEGRNRYRSLIAGERDHYEMTKRYIRKDGQIVWGRLTVSLVKQDKDVPSLAIGMVQDITESRKLEEQMRQAQKMEAIGKLAGGVAHDFNNILAVIQMQAGLMQESLEVPPMQRELAKEIIKASERAVNLTRQLLLFSRRQVFQAREHDLNEIVTNILKMLRRVLGEDIQVQFKWAMERLCIRADAGMLDQILMNLAVNARDAMPNGGQLIIETGSVNLDGLAAAKTPQGRAGSFACLTVSDTGCGISPEHLPHIFEPFFTTKEVGKGTGLGLATVFGIVQEHQGSIEVESKVGRGTSFRIYFPQIEPSIVEPRRTVPLPASMRSGDETILLTGGRRPCIENLR
jgi:PAS domain S-box-containing protein